MRLAGVARATTSAVHRAYWSSQMIDAESIAFAIAVTVAGLSLAYVALCIAVVRAWRRHGAENPATMPGPVTVLKPLCGAEPELAENLRSFCDQSYPTMQILLGARASDDPALDVARRVAAPFTDHEIEVLSGDTPLGPNRKINTLAHLLSSARHDVLVIADSDIRAGPSYLREVVTPLADASVGLVTCLYRGMPTSSVWSRVAALWIDEWLLPSVLVSRMLGSSAYCSGATMALRREVLEAAGGFPVLARLLADDHALSARISALGLRVVVSRYEVATTVHEPDVRALFAHELRWMRTIRTARPLGHACLFVTFALPMTIVALPFAHRHPWVIALPLLALALRIALHRVVQYPVLQDAPHPPRTLCDDRRSVWLIPARDLLSFVVWAASFASRRVTWREHTMRVRPDGILLTVEDGRSA